MKKKIAILGSTGSIGKTTLNIIYKDKKNFDVILLTANKNIKDILNQVNKFKVKNIIITSKPHYLILKKILQKRKKKVNLYNDFSKLNKIFNGKIDYVMSSITGLQGLEPTLKIIKHTKKIAIANKETIICGWNLVNPLLKKFKTEFIPVDSEHFSIWKILGGFNSKGIDKIYITASGGPLLNHSKKKIKKILPSEVTKHPMWSMGKKISVDSATLMNKVFEIIEAQRIFEINKDKFRILIHPKSYLHSLIKFNNGTTKLLIHDTDMKIPIFNSIYGNYSNFNSKKINFKIINNLDLQNPDYNKFPHLKLLKLFPNKISLFETVIISANDELVNLFLSKQISYSDIYKNIKKIINLKEFAQYKKKKPSNLNQIINLNRYVRLKTINLCIQ